MASGNLVYPGKPLSIDGCDYAHNATIVNLVVAAEAGLRQEITQAMYKNHNNHNNEY